MGKFSLAVDVAEYLSTNEVPASVGTYSKADDSEGLEIAFYTHDGEWVTMEYNIEEWASSIAIGDDVINIFNHGLGNKPLAKGESLYKKVSNRYAFGGRKARYEALKSADLSELLAAYRIACDKHDEKSMKSLGAYIDLLDYKQVQDAA